MKVFVALVLLAHVSQHASEVEVEKGKESVLLPCHFPPAVLKDHTVVWRRDDLRSEIIHTLRINYLSDQNDRYTNRTSMRADALQTGDLSLTLRNPTYTDTGNYTCATRNAGRDQNTTEVLLLVREPPLWPKVLSSVLVPVVLLGAIIIFLGYRISKRQKRTAVDQLEVVEVEDGEKSVLLPYKTTDLPEGFKVQWMYLKDEHSIICVYDNGQIQTNKQDAAYQTRTEMKISQLNQMETEELNQTEVELSLTLRNPRCEDGGVYICVVNNKEGKALKMKVVMLWVKESVFMAAKALILKGKKSTRRRMSSIPLEQLQTESTL